tara:strand:+ start:298 stop:1092 length:795 start_codon:yes stop_codon:yes gene_type:complete
MFNQINSVHIGGVRIDNVDMKESVQKIIDLIGGKEKHQISTPNLDFLYNASKNHQFRKILNSTFLNIPDGKPLILLSRLKKKPLKEKVSGADLFVNICQEAAKKNICIHLMGSKPGVAAQAKLNLEKKFSGLNIVGAVSPSFGFETDEAESTELIEQINKVKPDILFVGVGSPKQELWIAKYLDQLDIKVAIGVGASFDFAAGHVKIPPPFIKKAGFAWLWRLSIEPKRLWKRYLMNNLPLFIKLACKAIIFKEDQTDKGNKGN